MVIIQNSLFDLIIVLECAHRRGQNPLNGCRIVIQIVAYTQPGLLAFNNQDIPTGPQGLEHRKSTFSTFRVHPVNIGSGDLGVAKQILRASVGSN